MSLIDANTGCSPLTAPQQPESVRIRASIDSKVVFEPPVVSACPYVQYHPRRSSVHKIDKFYVGLLRGLPPPDDVQVKWNTDVRTVLENDLCQATRQLPQHMTDEEVMIELVLCMAGRKCSRSESALLIGNQQIENPLRMKPTVWIHCGSKKCKKKVSRSKNAWP